LLTAIDELRQAAEKNKKEAQTASGSELSGTELRKDIGVYTLVWMFAAPEGCLQR
jgi:hypothetical protein